MSDQQGLKSTVDTRFVSQTATTQDSQPIGLLELDDFRKEQVQAKTPEDSTSSGAKASNEKVSVPNPLTKKKRKQPVTAKLSFDRDEDDEPANHSKRSKSASAKDDESDSSTRKRLGPNTSVVAPKVMTKSAQLKEIGKKELLRKEFLLMQEAVKATEFEIPFVFFDGTNNPGGRCRIKKGEHVWLFLDRSRKIGADLGVTGGEGGRTGTRREWARISVDDLMLVRGEIIIPHHYDFYYFIVGRIKGHDGKILFPYAVQATIPSKLDQANELSDYDPLTAYKESKKLSGGALEGSDEDPSYTRVVDRRWYERNKHIFPASAWEEFDPSKDYSSTTRRDAGGNVYFFS
ncbi:MAG: hypothetical protein GOMPHAMPRED_007297 [Gomphillus americanus]|uniref:FAM50A/XAP5 C-terminal domain-containing protein n=1 Tax=Gomphillus americanus TaxID=1940652 RepID=A0A8H3ESY7_9LECA|nr:MAG: hypothetical protein GOMPHAMPRED_007297 [Gomphillus americanus]